MSYPTNLGHLANRFPGPAFNVCQTHRQSSITSFSNPRRRRVEAKVSALKPLMEDEAGTVMLAPPQLLFGRVDALDRR